MLFNEEIYRDDKKLLDFNNNIIFRKAVRAIILKDNKILMVFLGKTKEYKFPGGGVEENENPEEALKREVMEEVGYTVNKVIEKIGVMTEYAIANEGKGNIFKMVSEYYITDIEVNQNEQKLDNYEKELKYKPYWINIETAYNVNKNIIDNKCDTTPWIKRETRVLEILTGKILKLVR
ncbi:MAG: NUDIX domain-containing protein [Treponema sp.]|nr:NUDIX domain-containing protein [Treponema sp.]